MFTQKVEVKKTSETTLLTTKTTLKELEQNTKESRRRATLVGAILHFIKTSPIRLERYDPKD